MCRRICIHRPCSPFTMALWVVVWAACACACDAGPPEEAGAAAPAEAGALAALPAVPGPPAESPGLGTPRSEWTDTDDTRVDVQGMQAHLRLDDGDRVVGLDLTVETGQPLGEALERRWGPPTESDGMLVWFDPSLGTRAVLPTASRERTIGTLRIEHYLAIEALIDANGRFAFEPAASLLGIDAASLDTDGPPGTAEWRLPIRPVGASATGSARLVVNRDGRVRGFRFVASPADGAVDTLKAVLSSAVSTAPDEIRTLTRDGWLYLDPDRERRIILAERIEEPGSFDVDVEHYLPLGTIAVDASALAELRTRALTAAGAPFDSPGEYAFELPPTDWEAGPTRGRVAVVEPEASPGSEEATGPVVERVEIEIGFGLRRQAKGEIRAHFEEAFGIESTGKARVGDGKRFELGAGASAAISETVSGSEWLLELSPAQR